MSGLSLVKDLLQRIQHEAGMLVPPTRQPTMRRE